MNFFTEIKEGFGISWDAIRANKMRSGLTTLGIVIGIVTVTLMGAAIEGLNGAFLTSISALGTDVLFVQRIPWFSDEPWWKLRNRRDILLADARALGRMADPSWAINVEAGGVRTIKYQDKVATGVSLLGDSEEGAIVNGLTLREGRFMSGAEVDGGRPVCVIGADIAANFFSFESPIGKKIKIENESYEVVGVNEKRGKFLGLANLDNQVYIPITRFQARFSWRPGVTVMVKVGSVEKLEDAREELRGIMRKVRRLEPGQPDDFAINSQEAFLRTFNRLNGIIASVGLFITSLSLFVGGIGIMNIMFVSVAERTREIGIRKAIGAKQRTILVQFLIEAATICLLGGLMGLSIAWPISQVMQRFFPATMSPTIVGISLAVSVLTGLIAGFLPAWRAARMDPVDALRSE